ncbi:MAG: hypothetical protein ACT4TC_14655 [Myxococcaceae bacterium]
MRRPLLAVSALLSVVLTACGGAGSFAPKSSTSLSARQALAGTAEALEFEAVGTRLELYRELARTSVIESGRAAPETALFPLIEGQRRIAAPGFEPSADLLQAPDAGLPFQLAFGTRGGERWPEDRRESLQGLSEREAAELIARSLLALWSVNPGNTVQVDRASGAPYAVAYVDGILRVNPAFLYLVAAPPVLATAPVAP